MDVTVRPAGRTGGRSWIERIAPSLRRPQISHVIFDFDGTLSWLRHGWPEIMLNGFMEHAPADWRNDQARRSELLSEILSLNGKPTIHQVNAFVDKLRRDAGRAADPEQLFHEYEVHLHSAIRSRSEQAGSEPDAFVVHGARAMIERLRERGVTVVVLSGTVETEVRAEAELLSLARYFGHHIYGSTRGAAFSKKDVIDRLMREEQIEGFHLFSFGDGPVEIQFTKAAGGLAIGVASDENVNGSHQPDPFKREQLIRAGADAIIADYAHADELIAEIFES